MHRLYEQLAAGLVILTFGSLIQDRTAIAHSAALGYPFRNIIFYTGLLVILALGIITWVNYKKKWAPTAADRTGLHASSISSYLYYCS